MTPLRLEPAAPRSRVKHSTTEPLRSLLLYDFEPFVHGKTPKRVLLQTVKTQMRYRIMISLLEMKFFFLEPIIVFY